MINRHKNHVPNHQKFTKVILNLQEAVHLHFFQQLQGRWELLAAAAAPHDADVGADLRHLTRQRQVLQEILRSWTFCGKMADLPCGKIHITMENHHFEWENQQFLWQFSIANY